MTKKKKKSVNNSRVELSVSTDAQCQHVAVWCPLVVTGNTLREKEKHLKILRRITQSHNMTGEQLLSETSRAMILHITVSDKDLLAVTHKQGK